MALVAKNVYGGVCVGITNQLRLNTQDLEGYSDKGKYVKLFKDADKEVSCLNYKENTSGHLNKLPSNVSALMFIDIENNDICGLFECIKRQILLEGTLCGMVFKRDYIMLNYSKMMSYAKF